MALASAAQKAVCVRQLTTDLKSKLTGATIIFKANQLAISMAKNNSMVDQSV